MQCVFGEAELILVSMLLMDREAGRASLVGRGTEGLHVL